MVADLGRKAPLNKKMGPDELRAAAGRFKKNTSTVDGVHPGMIKYMDDCTLEIIGNLSACFVQGGRWPGTEYFVPVRLIPKPSGGSRPIASYRSRFRVYAACQRDTLRAWVKKVPDIGLNMRPGRRGGDSICRL